MGEKPNADWARTLGEVERSVSACLETLSRYESKFAKVFDPSPSGIVRFDEAGWQAKLAAAENEVQRAEQLIAEQEAEWNRWHESFGNWKLSVERLAVAVK